MRKAPLPSDQLKTHSTRLQHLHSRGGDGPGRRAVDHSPAEHPHQSSPTQWLVATGRGAPCRTFLHHTVKGLLLKRPRFFQVLMINSISFLNLSSEWGGLRRRNRHDTSDSGSALSGSPRKREGGSLPCDVARGTSRKKTSSAAVASAAAADENNSCVVTGLGGLQGCRAGGTDSASDIDCVINMEGVMEDRSGEDRFPESWNLRLDHSENSTSTASGKWSI